MTYEELKLFNNKKVKIGDDVGRFAVGSDDYTYCCSLHVDPFRIIWFRKSQITNIRCISPYTVEILEE